MFFNSEIEPYECMIELEQDGRIQRQAITAPKILIVNHITDIGRSICNSSIPSRCKVSRILRIYDQYEDKWIDRELSVEFMNKAYESMHKGSI